MTSNLGHLNESSDQAYDLIHSELTAWIQEARKQIEKEEQELQEAENDNSGLNFEAFRVDLEDRRRALDALQFSLTRYEMKYETFKENLNY